MTEPQTPRVDQRLVVPAGAVPGSRSGSGELAGALGYPGVPPAVPNLLGATKLQQGVTVVSMFTFPQAGRIWQVILSYAVTSNSSFGLATVRTVATVQTVTSALTLAVVQLGIANPNQHAEGTCPSAFSGLPVVPFETVRLNINNGTLVPQMDQQASASLLYSIP